MSFHIIKKGKVVSTIQHVIIFGIEITEFLVKWNDSEKFSFTD